jgi:hypothetical protein
MNCTRYWKTPVFVIIGIAAFIGLGFLLMTLWNYLIPPLFNGPVITFWQGVGLFVLAKILFHSGGHGSHARYWNRGRYYHWKSRMEERMAAMSPEEREKFRDEWNERCRPGSWHHRWSQHKAEQPPKSE